MQASRIRDQAGHHPIPRTPMFCCHRNNNQDVHHAPMRQNFLSIHARRHRMTCYASADNTCRHSVLLHRIHRATASVRTACADAPNLAEHVLSLFPCASPFPSPAASSAGSFPEQHIRVYVRLRSNFRPVPRRRGVAVLRRGWQPPHPSLNAAGLPNVYGWSGDSPYSQCQHSVRSRRLCRWGLSGVTIHVLCNQSTQSV